MSDNLLQPLARAWSAKIELARKAKKEFQEEADLCWKFFDGPYQFLYDPSSKYSGFVNGGPGNFPQPTFQMTHNRIAELVHLFLPQLLHRNPVRTVAPRKFPELPLELLMNPLDPTAVQMAAAVQQQDQMTRLADEARARLLEAKLNYTPRELGLRGQGRLALTEAIIKGMGILKTELWTNPTTGQRLIGTFWDSVDNVVVDPDAENPYWSDCEWIAVRCVHPVWKVEQMYGLAPGSLKGSHESAHHQGASYLDEDHDMKRKQGRTNDLITYWKVYSKMGMGGRLAGQMGSNVREMNEVLEQFGEHCYLVIAEHVPYPLNLASDFVAQADDQMLTQAVQWPTPFFHKKDGWPVKPIIFHEKPRSVWPQSHMKPALGELQFLNWAYSFVAGKIRTASRDFICVLKAAGEEIKQQLTSGSDYSLLEIETATGARTIADMVSFLQHPPFNGDVWNVVEAVSKSFEKRTGLLEIVYGETSTQARSATDSQGKFAQASIRPDDMREIFEQAMADVAAMEALAARVHLQPQDVVGIVGPVGAQLWAQLVMTMDIQAVATQLEYKIEAGSTVRPNKGAKQEQMTLALQTMMPIIAQFATATGDVTALNALMKDWAEAMDIPNPERYLIMLPQPAQPQAAPPEEAPPAEEQPPPEEAPPPEQQPMDPMMAALMGV